MPVLGILFSGTSAAQQQAPPSREVRYEADTGWVENLSSRFGVVASFEVRVPRAAWLRLYFDAIELSGDSLAGAGRSCASPPSRMVPCKELDRYEVREWHQSTAYFNGASVLVELLASPGSGASRLTLSSVTAGEVPVEVLSQCGPNDDRVLSNDPRAARLLPVGCTGWLIDDCAHCMLTAGHCADAGFDVVEFNVPLSSGGGALNHPPPEDQYAVDASSPQFLNNGVGQDWGYFGVFPNAITGLTPAEAQGAFYDLEPPPTFDSSENIRITGYGVDSSPNTHNQVQQTHFGPWFAYTGTQLQYQTDTEGGNSGSPVIHEPTGRAIGIHTHGGCSSSLGIRHSASHAGLQNALANPLGVCVGGIQLLDELPAVSRAGRGLRRRSADRGRLDPRKREALRSLRRWGLPRDSVDLPRQRDVPRHAPAAGLRRDAGVLFRGGHGVLRTPASALSMLRRRPSPPSWETRTTTSWTTWKPISVGKAVSAVTRRRPASGCASTPSARRRNPENDHTAPPGVNCWVTGQGTRRWRQLRQRRVDGGRTTLLSPVLDGSGSGDVQVSYWRWYSNDQGGAPHTDVFQVDVSADGGGALDGRGNRRPEREGTSGGWFQHTFRVADIVTPTSQLRLRFVAADLGAGSIVEAAVDDVRMFRISCDEVLADCNGNGILDDDDVASGRSGRYERRRRPRRVRRPGHAVLLLRQRRCPAAIRTRALVARTRRLPGALLSASGSASVGADDLVFTATSVPTNKNGIFYACGGGTAQIPFGDGQQCVVAGGTGIFRYAPVQNSGPTGTLVLGPGIVARSQSFAPAGRIQAGQTWNFQAWFRDPAGPCGSGFNHLERRGGVVRSLTAGPVSVGYAGARSLRGSVLGEEPPELLERSSARGRAPPGETDRARHLALEWADGELVARVYSDPSAIEGRSVMPTPLETMRT